MILDFFFYSPGPALTSPRWAPGDGDRLILQLDGRCCELNAAVRAASSAAAGTAVLKPESEPCAQR